MKKNKLTHSRKSNSAKGKALRTGAIYGPIYAPVTKDVLRETFDMLHEIKLPQKGMGRKMGRDIAPHYQFVAFAQWLDLFKQRPSEPNK